MAKTGREEQCGTVVFHTVPRVPRGPVFYSLFSVFGVGVFCSFRTHVFLLLVFFLPSLSAALYSLLILQQYLLRGWMKDCLSALTFCMVA